MDLQPQLWAILLVCTISWYTAVLTKAFNLEHLHQWKRSKISLVISNIIFPCSWYFMCVHSSEVYPKGSWVASGSLLEAEIWMSMWLLFSNITTKKQMLANNSQARARKIVEKVGIVCKPEYLNSNSRTHMKICTCVPMMPALGGGRTGELLGLVGWQPSSRFIERLWFERIKWRVMSRTPNTLFWHPYVGVHTQHTITKTLFCQSSIFSLILMKLDTVPVNIFHTVSNTMFTVQGAFILESF